MTKPKSFTYKEAGVDIDAGNKLVKKIKPIVKSSYRPGVMGSLGGFGGLFDLSKINCKNPVLVSGTDGVGTKLKIAQMMNDHSSIGIDLVAMCANDVIVMGAEPLFFLDYYACGKLSMEQATQVISGIAKGCKDSGCALIGGETAEMPGMYHNDDYDLAGFVVGIVDKEKIIDGSKIEQGNILIGIESSGPHSNGYSLIRNIITKNNLDINAPFENSTLGHTLLKPTTLYAKPILSLLSKNNHIKGISHITGGGIMENISRLIPSGLAIEVQVNNWQRPMIFNFLQNQGNIEDIEMLRTFNCGIGMVIICHENERENIISHFQSQQLKSWEIGKVIKKTNEDVVIRQ
ncbi:MAG: phosphoribosylformylglycinamidine cyclo-ligase [Proteobacteria bacterium]|nr:phosphoribosylformylglycinamidine cyclo-ligase [Pseudomonadota bacterium]